MLVYFVMSGNFSVNTLDPQDMTFTRTSCCYCCSTTVQLPGAIIDHTANVQGAKSCAPRDNHGLVMLADTDMIKIGGPNVCCCAKAFPNIDGMFESEEECAKGLATVVVFAEVCCEIRM